VNLLSRKKKEMKRINMRVPLEIPRDKSRAAKMNFHLGISDGGCGNNASITAQGERERKGEGRRKGDAIS